MYPMNEVQKYEKKKQKQRNNKRFEVKTNRHVDFLFYEEKKTIIQNHCVKW